MRSLQVAARALEAQQLQPCLGPRPASLYLGHRAACSVRLAPVCSVSQHWPQPWAGCPAAAAVPSRAQVEVKLAARPWAALRGCRMATACARTALACSEETKGCVSTQVQGCMTHTVSVGQNLCQNADACCTSYASIVLQYCRLLGTANLRSNMHSRSPSSLIPYTFIFAQCYASPKNAVCTSSKVGDQVHTRNVARGRSPQCEAPACPPALQHIQKPNAKAPESQHNELLLTRVGCKKTWALSYFVR